MVLCVCVCIYARVQVFVRPDITPSPIKSQPPGSVLATREALQALDSARVLPAPWWLAHLGSEDIAWWLQAIDRDRLAALPARKKIGFLNACE